MRPKTLAAYVMATAMLVAMMSIVTSAGEHSIHAQVMGDHGEGWVGNMTSGLQEHQQKMKINGTINLEQTIFEAIGLSRRLVICKNHSSGFQFQ